MRPQTLSEKLALAVIVLSSACTSDHHVSPWGAGANRWVEAYLPRPDLEGRLAAADVEAAALGLKPASDLRVELPKKGGSAVIRSYQGQDVTGRTVHAVRVATSLGVVMAVGPLDASDLDRQAATELVNALTDPPAPRAFRSGTDLNGDGLLDVVVRNEAGVLAIWHIDRLGSGPYPIVITTPPTRAVDVDNDGRMDLAGELPLAPGDPLGPQLVDIATFETDAYSDRSSSARAWHALRAGPRPGVGRDEVRLQTALERAWHALLAGDPADRTLQALHREYVPRPLQAAFEHHARVIEDLAARP